MLDPRIREALTETVRMAIECYSLEEMFRLGGVPAIFRAIQAEKVPLHYRENLLANEAEAKRVIAAALGMM